MKITDARVILTCPGRNFVTLKILTDQGVHGVGDATLNGRELSVAAYLTEHVIPCLIGRDAHQIEDIWQYLYRGAYWRRGPVTMSAIAAVDTALWDIKAKVAGLPLYQLLGGRSREGVMVYGHANGRDIAETSDEVHRYIEMGYLAIRAQTGIPGMASTYGVSGDKMFYEPADGDLPTENLWSTEKYLAHVPRLFETLRDRFGSGPRLLHDVHHRLTPIEAARLGKALEPCSLFWMEDATPAENQANFRLIRQHTVTPLAVGEIFNTIWDAIPTLMLQTRLNYYSLGRLMGVISSRLISEHPWLYLQNLALGWWWFWRVGVLWMPEALSISTLRPIANGLMLAERIGLFGINILFLGGSLALMWPKIRTLFKLELFQCFAVSAVWITSILQTLAEHGDNPRFLAPMQTLVVLIVATWIWNAALSGGNPFAARLGMLLPGRKTEDR